MERKDFIKTSLFLTGAILLPNAIWAFGKDSNVAPKNSNKFISKPNLKRFKVSDTGTKFFETELSIEKSKITLKLDRKFFISENINGICTPTLLETNQKESLVFISELYKDKKHNGFIVKVCENGLCEETKIFTHENQGYYAFWGKEYLGNPTLYHYNIDTFHLMRMHQENGQWINHRVMPIYPDEMMALYEKQLQQVEQGKLTQQFGYDFDIHKDGVYQFLSLKNDWEQSIITKEKEEYERENPAKIYNSVNEVTQKPENQLEFSYTNPFVPIYCKGDDLSFAIVKPTIIYEEVAGTKIEIPDMPAYKTQNGLGECRAFSLAVLLQHYTCQKWKSDIPDCKNPPADTAISYFGLLAYTNEIVDQPNTFQPNQNDNKGMYDIINDLSKSGNKLILENCKPFENLTNNFTAEKNGNALQNSYFEFLKNTYNLLQNKNEDNIKDCTAEIHKINNFVDLKISQPVLKNALTKENFNQFLYTLFFSDCKMENFPAGFSAMAYPLDSMNVTVEEIISQIYKGLNEGKPVLYTGLCISENPGKQCEVSHSLVISGYKKVKDVNNTKIVFKIHNSWGTEWQKIYNDGWIDANILCQNTSKIEVINGNYRFGSGTVIWLDP